MSDRFPFAAAEHLLSGAVRLAPLLAAADAAAIAAMLVNLDPWRTLGYRSDQLTRYLLRADPALHRFRILDREALIGVLCVRYPWLRGPYIELVGITPQARGSGLGSAIVGWVETEVLGEAGNLWACVSAGNQAARHFYAGRGFCEIAPIDDLVSRGHAEILLRKRLTG